MITYPASYTILSVNFSSMVNNFPVPLLWNSYVSEENSMVVLKMIPQPPVE